MSPESFRIHDIFLWFMESGKTGYESWSILEVTGIFIWMMFQKSCFFMPDDVWI
jgi:hypothetical protein